MIFVLNIAFGLYKQIANFSFYTHISVNKENMEKNKINPLKRHLVINLI